MKVTWPLGDLHSKYCGTTQKSETTKVDIPSECVGKSGTPKSAGLIISVAIKTAVLGYIYIYICTYNIVNFHPKNIKSVG